jgi:hypothetical protein
MLAGVGAQAAAPPHAEEEEEEEEEGAAAVSASVFARFFTSKASAFVLVQQV